MLTKTEYIQSQRDREQKAREQGFTDEEIKGAYQIAKEGRGVNYFNKYDLEEARSEINNKFRE